MDSKGKWRARQVRSRATRSTRQRKIRSGGGRREREREGVDSPPFPSPTAGVASRAISVHRSMSWATSAQDDGVVDL
jgi:hypothetical protein